MAENIVICPDGTGNCANKNRGTRGARQHGAPATSHFGNGTSSVLHRIHTCGQVKNLF